MRKTLVCYLLVVASHAQELGVDAIKKIIDAKYPGIVSQPPGMRPVADIKDLISLEDLEFSSLVQRKLGLAVFPKTNQQMRRDTFDALFKKLNATAIGAVGNATGSTSVVSGSGVPMILNLALERGGITQSTKGAVLSMKGNLLGVARGLGASDAYCLALECGAKEDFLRRVTFGVGFDMSRTAAESGSANVAASGQPVAFSLQSAKEQFDHFIVRFDISNRRDIRGSYFQRVE